MCNLEHCLSQSDLYRIKELDTSKTKEIGAPFF